MKSSTILVLAIACAVIFLMLQRSSPPVPPDSAHARAYWTDVITKEGPHRAYQDFLARYQKSDFGAQHTAAHLFGRLLYEAEGAAGIAICDPSFAFGCYHGFFAAAITAEGLAIVPALDKACATLESAPSGCRHGIGHGVMEYLGYSELDKALGVCKDMTTTDVIGGCYSGVFMDYNQPINVNADGSVMPVPRILDLAHPYDPCPSVASAFQDSCYHELPQWWESVYQQDYAHLKTLCDTAPAHRSVCVRGIGNAYFASHDQDVAASTRFCATMPPDDAALCTADFTLAPHL
jgi:hypothetical protein